MSQRQVVKSFSWDTGYYRLTVPRGYSPTINITLDGGSGGEGGEYYNSTGGGGGGHGARLTGTLNVKEGDVLDIYLGEGGKKGGYHVNGGAGGRGAKIGTPEAASSGAVWPVTLSWAWSGFMNAYAVWVNPDGVSPVGVTNTVIRNFTVPSTGTYRVRALCDNYLDLYVDGALQIQVANFQDSYGAWVDLYLTAGEHTIRMDMTNWGGPAGTAVVVQDRNANVIWNTRSQLQPNVTNSYWFKGGKGGNTYPDGGYIYPAAGGGGGASAIFLNGKLILVAAGGGGGGAEGGHGAGGTAGLNGGVQNTANPNPYACGAGEDGSDGYDIGGTPGGGAGYVGGGQGYFIYYDDAPSGGAQGGTNYIAAGSFTQGNTGGGGPGNGLNGVCTVTFTELGSGKVKVGGSWKQITNQYVKVAGRWKQVTNVWTKVNGVWKIVSGGTEIPSTFTSANYG